MVCDQRLGLAVIRHAVAAAALATLAGCAWFQSRPAGEDTASARVTSAEAPASAEVAQAENAIDAALARSATESTDGAGSAQSRPAVTSDLINPHAPKSYTVKRGDTLWDISSMFLRDPWLWPEIWYVNPNVQNPHLIYPGDVLALAYGADGSPQIRLERGSALRVQPTVRSTPLDGPIATIPFEAIAAFLSRPSIVSKEDVKRAPHVLALRDNHIVAGTGNEVYVRGLPANAVNRYSVVSVGDKLRDPDDGDVLGYMGTYTATAHISQQGKVSKAVLSDAKRETIDGDLLFSEDATAAANFIPHAPTRSVDGEIISVVDGISIIGQYQVVAINRGERHGLEPGHVLAVDNHGIAARDHCKTRNGPARCWGVGKKVRLPDERAGTLLVFKSFDRMSYGLVVAASSPLRVTDRVRNP